MKIIERASVMAFFTGLVLIAADGVLYLFEWRHAGIAFCLGMALCMLSVIFTKGVKREETIVLAAAGLAFIWVASRAM